MNAPSPVLKLANVSAAGLLLDHGGRQELANWHRVEDISVGTIPAPDGGTLFMMAIEIEGGRIAACAETESVWDDLNLALTEHLPNTIPFEAWGPFLVATPAACPILIYSRWPMGTA